MAEVIIEDAEPQTFSAAYSIWKVASVGASIGLLYWCLTAFIGIFVDSINVSGDIATILTATLGVVIMLRLSIFQPLIIALASGLALWSLAGLTSGLVWFEIIAWNILLYALAYTLFSWIARYNRVIPALAIITIIIIAVRVAISL